jgi:hypothetical protein
MPSVELTGGSPEARFLAFSFYDAFKTNKKIKIRRAGSPKRVKIKKNTKYLNKKICM